MPREPSDRLYALLPAYLRVRDAGEGQPLRALMRVFEREYDILDADIDQLYRNTFIETCDEWVVPYIGDLLGVRPLATYGTGDFSLRAYVANTLAYRRAKGTAAVLEQLARDITGWNARVVEFFERLTWTQNLNHPRPDSHHTVDLRAAGQAEQVGSPFERATHTVGVRPIRTGRGRYNIMNVGIFLWRLQSYPLSFTVSAETGYLGGVSPRAAPGADPGRYFFNPLGADAPLFNRAQSEALLAHIAEEANVPGPLRRRPLHEDLNALRTDPAHVSLYFGTQPVLRVRLDGVPVPAARLRCCTLDDQDDGAGGIAWPHPADPGWVLFDPVLGRFSVHPADADNAAEVTYAYGFPQDLGGGPYDRRDSVGRWLPRLVGDGGDPAEPPLWQIGVSRRSEDHTPAGEQDQAIVGSLAEALERWQARAAPDARGIIAILDNATYDEPLTTDATRIDLPSGSRLAIVAAGWPAEDAGGGAIVRTPGRLVPQDRRPHLLSDLRVRGTAAAQSDAGELILDGLLIEGGLTVMAGDLGALTVAECTLGAAAGGLTAGPEVAGEVAAIRVLADPTPAGAENRFDNARLRLFIDRAICGRIDVPHVSGPIAVADSILGEDRLAGEEAAALTGAPVLTAPLTDLTVQRSTVFGTVTGRTLDADSCLFSGIVTIARRQEGCVRLSYLPPGSHTPRHYRCQPDLALAAAAEEAGASLPTAERAAIAARLRPLFTSTRYGHPAFAQLGGRCPAAIREGGEADSEMGAYNAHRQAQREANLIAALDEYLRFGLEAGLIYVT